MSVCSCGPRPDGKVAYYNRLNAFEMGFYDKHLDLFKKIEFRFFLEMGQKFLKEVSPPNFDVSKVTQLSHLVISMREKIDFMEENSPRMIMMMAFVDFVEKKID